VLVVREGRIVHEAPAEDLDEHRVLDLVMVSTEQTTGRAAEQSAGQTAGQAAGSDGEATLATDSDSGSDAGSGVAIPPSEGAFDD
ncbi:hypothetical protein, partial [Microbispora sp. CSR-4]|uniref:hypothetical protein n=1 Tax=Microbispora sp. CSR-4 TaxID=2592813 RepID=UPI001C9CB7F8